jgi:hypothetical protein
MNPVTTSIPLYYTYRTYTGVLYGIGSLGIEYCTLEARDTIIQGVSTVDSIGNISEYS